jgi:hypothetical protein
MRELTKSMLSYTWAVSMFGVQQMTNLFASGNGKPLSKATAAFNQVTGATLEQMGDTMRATFRAGDQLQRGMVDLMLGGFMRGCNPESWMRNGTQPPSVNPQPAPATGSGMGSSSGPGMPMPSWSWGTPRDSDRGPAARAAPDPPGRTAAPSAGMANGAQEPGWGPMP